MAYLGEICILPFGTAPDGWHACDGTALPIATNQALYSLLGTQFGGDGATNFKLPDLRGRVPVGGHAPGVAGGMETVPLTSVTTPPHSHVLYALNKNADTANARDCMLAIAQSVTGETTPRPIYSGQPGPSVALNGPTITTGGGGEAHPNMQPFAVVNFCICLRGEFPSRN